LRRMFIILIVLLLGGCLAETKNNDEKLEEVKSRSTSKLQLVEGDLEGYYKIISKLNNKALCVYEAGTENGANVHMWKYINDNYTDQHWILKPAEDGYYTIVNRKSLKYLDVSNVSNENGANIHQWLYWAGDNQKWKLKKDSDGYIVFTSKQSGKVLDIDRKDKNDGANVIQWEFNDGDNQKWMLHKLDIDDLESGDIVVASNGQESGKGTLASPLDLKTAILKLEPGNRILMRGGEYKYRETIRIKQGNNGTKVSKKIIEPYNGEKVIIDFSAQSYSNSGGNSRGIQLDGDYWHIKNINVRRSADNGMHISGNWNIIEKCDFYENRDTGLQLSCTSSSKNIEDWPSNNLILDCYSYDNFDPDDGEDADGFAAKLSSGYGNIFRGCVAKNNVDDGWDLYTYSHLGPIGAVRLENCEASNNGITSSGKRTENSDGNGFKLGGSNVAVDHILVDCRAYNNMQHGFTNNSNPGNITLINCDAANNAGEDFKIK